ncbi:MAG: hypothetical protein JST68_12660 [Bacteroidetes bacterium]|nr:hypothetical protein [Bacteroidota bacterium]
MKKLLLLFITLAGLRTRAQDPWAKTYTPEKKPVFSRFHLELPMLETKVGLSATDKSLQNLPYGMGNIFSHTTPYTSFMWTSVRWFALYYKDCIGLEFYSDSYTNHYDPSRFSSYLQSRYPGYYLSPGWLVSDFEFGGHAFGLAYRTHWKSFVLQTKFLLGFESFNNDSIWYQAYFKQPGSNQFVEYGIGRYNLTPHQQNYQGRLLIGKRWQHKTEATEYEVGAQFEYIYSPYTMQLLSFDHPYGQPPIDNQVTARTSVRVINLGLYATLYPHWWRRKR